MPRRRRGRISWNGLSESVLVSTRKSRSPLLTSNRLTRVLGHSFELARAWVSCRRAPPLGQSRRPGGAALTEPLTLAMPLRVLLGLDSATGPERFSKGGGARDAPPAGRCPGAGPQGLARGPCRDADSFSPKVRRWKVQPGSSLRLARPLAEPGRWRPGSGGLLGVGGQQSQAAVPPGVAEIVVGDPQRVGAAGSSRGRPPQRRHCRRRSLSHPGTPASRRCRLKLLEHHQVPAVAGQGLGHGDRLTGAMGWLPEQSGRLGSASLVAHHPAGAEDGGACSGATVPQRREAPCRDGRRDRGSAADHGDVLPPVWSPE